MKPFFLFIVLIFGAIGVWILIFFNLLGKNLVVEKSLPQMCRLFTMSLEERLVHQNKLKDIQQAGQLVRETSDGFIFNVNLQKMSFEDLKLWMENEQKCCSFLWINCEVLKQNSLAQVTVVCPLDSRSEVMRTFGIELGRPMRINLKGVVEAGALLDGMVPSQAVCTYPHEYLEHPK